MNRFRPGQVVLVSEDNGNRWRKCRYNRNVTPDQASVTDLKTMKNLTADILTVFAYHTGRTEGIVLHSRAEERRLKKVGL